MYNTEKKNWKGGVIGQELLASGQVLRACSLRGFVYLFVTLVGRYIS